MSEETFITGEIKAILFENRENFYKVLLVELIDTNTEYLDEEIVITGHFGAVASGEQYRFIGKMFHHSRYGLQFQSTRYTKEQPSNEEALINFLSSRQFPGIGQVTAKKLVDSLGTDLIDEILTDEDCAERLDFLSQKQRRSLVAGITESMGGDQAILFLNQLGLTNDHAYKIYDTFQEETIETVKENPYVLYEIIDSLSFERVDNIAADLEIAPDALSRLEAGVLYTLKQTAAESGDTYALTEKLCHQTVAMLERARAFIIDPDLIYDAFEELVNTGRLVIDEDRSYLPVLFGAEYGIAGAVERINAYDHEHFTAEEIAKAIDEVESALTIQYDTIQRQAIRQAMTSPLLVLTGGPGTGKTTIIKGIIETFAHLHQIDLDDEETFKQLPILQAAPTGRAAKRMQESTNLPASTIHSLLQLKVEEATDTFEDVAITLEGKLLIVDEMSMIDTWLMYQLMQAVPSDMQVIFIGDKNQLPPVGPGQVFRDLIDSQVLPMIRLTKIYRQAEDSSIIELAYQIRQGQLPADFMKQRRDRNFFTAPAYDVVPLVENIVTHAIQKGYTAEDIQVLSPMYKSEAGINQLNVSLQELFNPANAEKDEVEFGGQVYRVGDKILQTKNDPEQGVFNGDMGMVVGFVDKKYTESKREEMVLDFNGKKVYYPRSEWIHLALAYCCSIHKAQGSEYPIVILPLVFAFRRMLKRDLLYTAVTRASQSLVLCGDPRAFYECLKTTSSTRQTTLKERLLADQKDKNIKKAVSKTALSKMPVQEFILTPQLVEQQAVDPMIGMDQVTPFDH